MGSAWSVAVGPHPRPGRGLLPWWPVVLVAVVALGYATFAGGLWWLQADAYRFAAAAQRDFEGDEVDALLALVETDSRPLAERNRAVHALGRLGDRRALPVLASYYTGGDCDHARGLCQRELQKAIDLCSGRSQLPRWLPLLPHGPDTGSHGSR